MKRVLIITYYWPPSGGSGVQRWLKMSKYLPDYDWQPVIYTTENAEYPIIDPSLEKDVPTDMEVIRRPIHEPYNFYKKFLGIKKEETVKMGFIHEKEKKKGWKVNFSLWIRGNLFIPDARCGWVKPSVKYLKEYLKEHPVDAIISTGPPHSMHLIAMKLKEELGIPWIADFRDPWTEIDYYNDLHLTRCADRKHHRLEREVLTNLIADIVAKKGNNYRQFYYPAASYCYAYQPTYALQPGEVLADKFKAHNWWLPTLGELGMVYWQQVKGGIFATAQANSRYSNLTADWHWTSTEYDATLAWILHGGNGQVSSNYTKYNSRACRAVVAF